MTKKSVKDNDYSNPRLNAGLLPLLTRLETRKTQLFSLEGQVHTYVASNSVPLVFHIDSIF